MLIVFSVYVFIGAVYFLYTISPPDSMDDFYKLSIPERIFVVIWCLFAWPTIPFLRL